METSKEILNVEQIICVSKITYTVQIFIKVPGLSAILYNRKHVEEPTRGACFQVNTERLNQYVVENLTVFKFNQLSGMENQKQNFIACAGPSRYSDVLLCNIQDLQDSTITCPSWIQDPQDPTKYFLSEIQDL